MECKPLKPKFSIEVFEDHAMIKGWIESKTLVLLLKLCKWYGFTHLIPTDDGQQGFKLVRKDKN